MDFEDAIKACKNGAKIRNTAWNGQNAYVYYVPPHEVCTENWAQSPGVADDLTDAEKIRGYISICGHFDMVTAKGDRLIGWLASQLDMQSERWVVVE